MRRIEGPWEVVEPAPNSYAPRVFSGTDLVAVIGNSDMHMEQRIANARLIAAAPELLGALEDMLSGWLYLRSVHGDLYGVGWDRCENKARSAIAKVKGETP